jgi:hypothetical protein
MFPLFDEAMLNQRIDKIGHNAYQRALRANIARVFAAAGHHFINGPRAIQERPCFVPNSVQLQKTSAGKIVQQNSGWRERPKHRFASFQDTLIDRATMAPSVNRRSILGMLCGHR